MPLTQIEAVRLLVVPEEVIRMSESGLSRIQIAEQLRIKPAALSYQMKKVGFSFKKESYRLTRVQIEEVCSKYLEGKSSKLIAKTFGCSEDTVLKALRSNHIEIKTSVDYADYKVNLEAFENPHDSDCAYFFGWLLTDGCIYGKEGNERVSLEVSEKDAEILRNLKKYVGTNPEIRVRKREDSRTGKTYSQASFSFTDKILVKRLKDLGLTSRKSLKEVVPENFKYNRDFWRGVLEGDGHIRPGSRYEITICGSQQLCDSFSDYCRKIHPTCNPSIRTNGRGLYTVHLYNKASCKIILDSLYVGCKLMLPRKYNTYLEVYCAD